MQQLSSMKRHTTHIHQHGRTHLLPFVERQNTYNHQHGRTHLLPSVKSLKYYRLWKGSALTSTSMIGHNYYHLWKGTALTSNHVGTNPIVILEWPSSLGWGFLVTNQVPPFQEWHSALISDHVGTNPTVTSEWLSTHIWHGRNQSSHHDRMAQPLHLTMEGTNPLTILEFLTDSSLPLGGKLDMENTKLLCTIFLI